MSDPVNHPDHYLKAAITIEPIELTSRVNSCLGQAINYVMRRQHKHPEKEIEELEKAKFYFNKFKDEVLYEYDRKTKPRDLIIHLGCSEKKRVEALCRVFHLYTKDTATEHILGYLLQKFQKHFDEPIINIIGQIDFENEKIREKMEGENK